MNKVFENLYAGKELQSQLFCSVCGKYGLTLAEMLILLYLSNNDDDTAKDIVEKLKLTKSHVSISVRALRKRGYLKGSREPGDRRTVHLSLRTPAAKPIADARAVEEQFISIVENGFSPAETAAFQSFLTRATDNMNAFLGETKVEEKVETKYEAKGKAKDKAKDETTAEAG